MAINQILPFGLVPSANVLSPQEYAALEARLAGFQAGVARSQEVNTTLRQASFVTSSLAQFVADRSGEDVLDDGDTAAFVARLTRAVIASIASASESNAGVLPIATRAMAQAWEDDSSALTPAKLADAFMGNNQLKADNGYQKLPGGVIIQWGRASVAVAGVGTVTYPVAFPSTAFSVIVSAFNSDTTGEGANVISHSRTSFQFVHLSNNSQSAGSIRWFAIGA